MEAVQQDHLIIMDDINSKRNPKFGFFGLDLGNDNARLAKTVYDAEQDQIQPPEVRLFEKNPALPAVVAFESDKRITFNKRREIQALLGRVEQMEGVEKDFISALATQLDTPMIQQGLQTLAEHIFRELRQWLRFGDYTPQKYPLTVGIPADWSLQSPVVDALLSILLQAGFQGIHTLPDAIAVVYYHLFQKDVVFHLDQFQSWLVIDVGGKMTRFTRVEKPAGSAELRVGDCFITEWGGSLMDETLYNQVFLPRFWNRLEPPTPKEKFVILQFIAELKEKLFANYNALNTASINFNFGIVKDPVELTRQEFESEQVCGSLMTKFRDLLSGEQLTGPGFQGIEAVILAGAGVGWMFVQEAIFHQWPGARQVMANNPALSLVKGLALASAGFIPIETPETRQVEIEISQPSQNEPQPPQPPPDIPLLIVRRKANLRNGPGLTYPAVGSVETSQSLTVYGCNPQHDWFYVNNPQQPNTGAWILADAGNFSGAPTDLKTIPFGGLKQPGSRPEHPKPLRPLDTTLEEKHRLARSLIWKCILGGAAFALAVSWIPVPGLSAPVLMGIEIFMFLKIAVSYYGYKLGNSTVLLLAVVLVIVSTILSVVIGDIVGMLPGLFFIKPIVAGLVIWGLGEGAILTLDRLGKTIR